MVRVRYSFGSRHTGRIQNITKQRAKYPQVMKDVIAISEIILEVIDARFIAETRNASIEADVKDQGKKIISVFNKADLVNKDKVPKTSLNGFKPYVFVSTKSKEGIKELRDKIRIEAKRVDIGDKKRVHVGIIGYPNAGKSSLINVLARRSVASTSKQAGHTKGMQKIRLVEKILLLDTPGVIPEADYSSDKKDLHARDATLGARTYSHVKNPEEIVHYLLKENAGVIEEYYGIKFGGDVEVLIDTLGKQKNFLAKGGKVDVDRTARLILRDWQEGKIK